MLLPLTWDWFWRGWFFTTDHVDINLASVKPYRINSRNPEVENAMAMEKKKEGPKNISEIRYAEQERENVRRGGSQPERLLQLLRSPGNDHAR
jgi:hypothetical protein